MNDRDISAEDLASFTPQACQGCNEFFPSCDLEELEEGSVLLYCSGCIFDAQKRSDETRDWSHYG